jgi:glycine betaine/proline transport system permease protein
MSLSVANEPTTQTANRRRNSLARLLPTKQWLAHRCVIVPTDFVFVLSCALFVGVVWRFGVGDPVRTLQSWVRNSRESHWLFTLGFTPLATFLKTLIEGFANGLTALPKFVFPACVGLILLARNRRLTAVLATLAAFVPALLGVWEPAMDTLALMIVSVLFCLLVGVPLGVAVALSLRTDRVLRPVLDAMQTVPSTVYLIPATLFFGLGQVPAAVATVIFALPPVIRLTALGITGVPEQTVEAAHMFGASKVQTLRQVQLPLAVPSIAAGVNQTIMMALGIIVVAALVGAGGLGQEVRSTLLLRSPGRGMLVGIAVVALATVLDRLSASFIPSRKATRTSANTARATALVAVNLAAGWFVMRYLLNGTPLVDWVDDSILWVRDNGRWIIQPVNDFVIREVLIRARDLLTQTIPAPVLVGCAALLGFWAKGWKLALGIISGLSVVGLMGMWAISVETLVQVLTATLVSALVAFPIGVFIGRRPRLEALVAPVMDALQTIPSLIYTIPFVMIFSISVVPGGIIASSLYAIPAGIRLAALGIRQVPEAPVEAATSFGASNRQLLWGVRLPLALPAIMLALNQIIMMVLSMVVIAGMTGSGALGYKAVEALTRSNTGLGVEVGIAIVVMAMTLDRLTQSLAKPRHSPI